jgi:subtilisin family serine protease
MRLRLTLLLSFFFLLPLVFSCQGPRSREVFPERNQSSMSTHCSELIIPNQYIVKYKSGLTRLVTSREDAEILSSFGEKEKDDIELIEYNKEIILEKGPLYSYNAHTVPSKTWGQDIIDLSFATTRGYKGRGVIVAVVDTTVDINHPTLKNQIALNEIEASGQQGLDDDQNGFADDVYGWDFYFNKKIDLQSIPDVHGTHVAGIIAGSPSPAILGAPSVPLSETDPLWSGVATEAKIIPISFMSNDGYGSISSAVNSLRYAKIRGAHIINASWGGPLCSKILEDEIQSLTQKGVLFVSASGNSGFDLDWQPEYPAAFNFPLQITVAASRPSDFLASFSNTSYKFVHIGAPGDTIWSSMPNDEFGYLSGTSMAAPFVTGAAAILMSARPDLPSSVIKEAILKGVDTKSYRVQSSGRLNLRKSLEFLLAQPQQ